ncbi:MAG: hypothetical protein GY906_13500, partial [bacterium]|nr:hypothetical protein [bacterium]
ADPWRIAIQLHAVRYGDSDLSPQRAAEIAVDRYGERPDLWTEAVTHQLWLLAAEADLVEESSAWPEELRPSWRHPVSGRGLLAIEVRQWGGGMLQPMPGTIGLLIDGQPANPGWTGRPEPREFESGTHEFRFLNGQLHSSSVKIEIEPGTTKTVLLIAIAGV